MLLCLLEDMTSPMELVSLLAAGGNNLAGKTDYSLILSGWFSSWSPISVEMRSNSVWTLS